MTDEFGNDGSGSGLIEASSWHLPGMTEKSHIKPEDDLLAANQNSICMYNGLSASYSGPNREHPKSKVK
jgi:hypothetical protein